MADENTEVEPPQSPQLAGEGESQEGSPGQAKATDSKSKVDVLLKPAGDAPIMKRKKWAAPRNKKINWIIEFVKKYLKLGPEESLFLYVNQAFAPSPDTEIGTVFDCFGSDGKLVLHYCRSQAWG